MAPWKERLMYCLQIFTVVFFSLTNSTDTDLQEYDFQFWQQTYRENEKILLALYKPDGCQKCQAMLDSMENVVGQPDLPEGLVVGKSSDPDLLSKLGTVQLPSLVFLRDKSHAFYDGPADVEQIIHWTQQAMQKATQRLDDDSFEHLTQASSGATTGDWLVVFFQGKCTSVFPILESVGVRIRQRTNVAKVDVSNSPGLKDRFAIKKCPEIILFKQGKMYRYELPKMDVASLQSFAESWYKNSKAEVVPTPKSGFDHLTESIAQKIKEQLEGENRNLAIAAICGLVLSILTILVCCCCSVKRDNVKRKRD